MQQIPGSIIAILVAIAIGTLPHLQKKINFYMMGFFRDISRVKARKRRMNSNALANISISIQDIKSMVFDEEEDPLQDVADKIMHENGLIPTIRERETYHYTLEKSYTNLDAEMETMNLRFYYYQSLTECMTSLQVKSTTVRKASITCLQDEMWLGVYPPVV
eukprot:365931_1